MAISLLVQAELTAQSWQSIGPYGGDRYFIDQDPVTLYTGLYRQVNKKESIVFLKTANNDLYQIIVGNK